MKPLLLAVQILALAGLASAQDGIAPVSFENVTPVPEPRFLSLVAWSVGILLLNRRFARR